MCFHLDDAVLQIALLFDEIDEHAVCFVIQVERGEKVSPSSLVSAVPLEVDAWDHSRSDYIHDDLVQDAF